MANLNDALQRNNPLLDKLTYSVVYDLNTGATAGFYPDQAGAPVGGFNPIIPGGTYVIISNHSGAVIELKTLAIEAGIAPPTLGTIGIPIADNGNLMLAVGSQTQAVITGPVAVNSNIVLTWFS